MPPGADSVSAPKLTYLEPALPLWSTENRQANQITNRVLGRGKVAAATMKNLAAKQVFGGA